MEITINEKFEVGYCTTYRVDTTESWGLENREEILYNIINN